jgi:hypothetical protein
MSGVYEMPTPTASLYSQAEIADRGHQIYDSQIRPHVEADHNGEIVAIDILTGNFAIAIDSLTAAKQVLANHPDAQIFCIRIGYPAVHRLGYHSPKSL